MKKLSSIALVLGVLCLSVSCSKEAKFKSYLNNSGIQVESVILQPGATADQFVGKASAAGLIDGYAVDLTWDVVFDGGNITSVQMCPAEDVTVKNLATGEQCPIGDYVEKVYFPALANPAFPGSTFIDGLFQDEDFYLRHREAWLSTIPVGDRALFQVRGPVKTLTTSTLYWYPYGGDGLTSRNDGLDFLLVNQRFTLTGVASNLSKYSKSGKGSSTVYRRNVRKSFPKSYIEYIREQDVLTYKNGRLASFDLGVWGMTLTYGEKNDLMRKSTYYVYYYNGKDPLTEDMLYYWGEPDHETVHYTYDLLGNCISEKTSEYSSDGTRIGSTAKNYVITQIDRLGNWTERRRSDGVVESRVITYFYQE